MEEVAHTCDRVIVIHRGEIAADGTLQELAGGASADGTAGKRESLEELFFRLTGARDENG
jgi:ABC-type multidrug transport system ATPase subunit